MTKRRAAVVLPDVTSVWRDPGALNREVERLHRHLDEEMYHLTTGPLEDLVERLVNLAAGRDDDDISAALWSLQQAAARLERELRGRRL